MKHHSSCKCDRCRRVGELRKAHNRRVLERTQGVLTFSIAEKLPLTGISRSSGGKGGDAA